MHVAVGNPKIEIPQLVKKYDCDAIYRNEAFDTKALKRDTAIKERAKKHGITVQERPDYLIVEQAEIPPRKVYTPFMKLRKKSLHGEYHKDAQQKNSYRTIINGEIKPFDISSIQSPPSDIDDREKQIRHLDTGKHQYRPID